MMIAKLNHPRCWSDPSKYKSAGQSSFHRGSTFPSSTQSEVDPLSNHTSKTSTSFRNAVSPSNEYPEGRISDAGSEYQASEPFFSINEATASIAVGSNTGVPEEAQ